MLRAGICRRFSEKDCETAEQGRMILWKYTDIRMTGK